MCEKRLNIAFFFYLADRFLEPLSSGSCNFGATAVWTVAKGEK
ncbi:unnamed protein product [Ixodes pacificus]